MTFSHLSILLLDMFLIMSIESIISCDFMSLFMDSNRTSVKFFVMYVYLNNDFIFNEVSALNL